MIAQQLLNGLIVGGVYALFALGFTLVFGIQKILNLAHGAVFTTGAFTAYYAVQSGLPLWVGLLAAMLVCGLLSVLIEFVCFSRLRKTGDEEFGAIISSIGAGLVIMTVLQRISNTQVLRFPFETFPVRIYEFLGLRVTLLQLFMAGCAVVLVFVLYWLIYRTSYGRQIRAVTDNERASTLVGINPNGIYRQVYFVSGALAGVAGVLVALAFNSIHFAMGALPALRLRDRDPRGPRQRPGRDGRRAGLRDAAHADHRLPALGPDRHDHIRRAVPDPDDPPARPVRQGRSRRIEGTAMSGFIFDYIPVFDLFLLHLGFAFSQYIALRSGVFSLATAGFAAIGAYAAGILSVRLGLPSGLGILVATLLGTGAALVLSLPLSKLRGVYQAIATVAFVQIVVSLNIYLEGLTGGAMGLNGIPHTVGTPELFVAVAAVTYLMWAINSTRLGRTFDVVREDEAVAVSLGVPMARYQALGFALSGAVAGLFGGLEAHHTYALEPNQFGFTFLIAILSYVVLGGRKSVLGSIVGTAVLIALPELARPLAENRILVYGLLLILVINFLPSGIADTSLDAIRLRRLGRRTAGGSDAGPGPRKAVKT